MCVERDGCLPLFTTELECLGEMLNNYNMPAVRTKPPRIKMRSEVIDLRATPGNRSPENVFMSRMKPTPPKTLATSTPRNLFVQASSTTEKLPIRNLIDSIDDRPDHDDRRQTPLTGHRLRSDSIISLKTSKELAAPLNDTDPNALQSSHGRRHAPISFLDTKNEPLLKCTFEVNHKPADVEITPKTICWSFLNQG